METCSTAWNEGSLVIFRLAPQVSFLIIFFFHFLSFFLFLTIMVGSPEFGFMVLSECWALLCGFLDWTSYLVPFYLIVQVSENMLNSGSILFFTLYLAGLSSFSCSCFWNHREFCGYPRMLVYGISPVESKIYKYLSNYYLFAIPLRLVSVLLVGESNCRE